MAGFRFAQQDGASANFAIPAKISERTRGQEKSGNFAIPAIFQQQI